LVTNMVRTAQQQQGMQCLIYFWINRSFDIVCFRCGLRLL
jgi:hypothetical protein